MQYTASFFLLSLSLGRSDGSVAEVGVQGKLSPITRVVELLKSLSLKIEHESDEEEKLYKSFVCWGTGVIADKTASNAKARSRIDVLETYIADLDAGRIELTTERVDLEKELEVLHNDMELATEIRAREAEDFAEAQTEMNQAIAALNDAIRVLKTATDGHRTGVLLRLHDQLKQGSRSGVAEAASLSHAVELGKKFLTKADAHFLQRLLTGDVPTWDWKKLNRQATFKMSYKARSFKIQDVLNQLLMTFTSNLADATAKEEAAIKTFDSLMLAKGNLKTAAQMALDTLTEENGARGISRSDAVEEKDDLTKQVADDEKYIRDVQTALDNKKSEWKARLALRSSELEAISKAIAILHADDARDLFKKSFTSQGYSFLQRSQSSQQKRRGSAAAEALREAGRAASDARLASLAASVEATGSPSPAPAPYFKSNPFEKVLVAISNMLTTLKAEEVSDLDTKETCEQERADDTRDAADYARKIDEDTELMDRLSAEIAELVHEIAEKHEQIRKIDETLEEMLKIRTEENAAYVVARKDDVDAAQLVVDAISVLKSFYIDNGLMLVQQRQKQNQPAVPAGAAPPPPPTTWDAPAYGGKVMESEGIISVLGMIEEDIRHDIQNADDAEQKAVALFNQVTNDLRQQRADLVAAISTLEGIMSGKETLKGTTKTQRGNKMNFLASTMGTITDKEPGCNYFTLKYPLRLKNRQIEIDGLLKAQAILSGADFGTPADPNRELRPFDALLQKHHQ